jgi:hypothetical protein
MRARYYNPLIRRFVNADPAQQGWTQRGSAKMVRRRRARRVEEWGALRAIPKQLVCLRCG